MDRVDAYVSCAAWCSPESGLEGCYGSVGIVGVGEAWSSEGGPSRKIQQDGR